jgi:hypothetical protein
MSAALWNRTVFVPFALNAAAAALMSRTVQPTLITARSPLETGGVVSGTSIESVAHL